jgi:RNA polymerase sigma-70 factor (ECF subfamily)
MLDPLDRHVVESVYRRYGVQVERCCRQILRDPDDAADAAQEVFLKLFTRGGSFRAEADWMTWLYRVSVNECLNRLRNHETRQRLLDHHGPAALPAQHTGPAPVLERDSVRALLRLAGERTQAIVTCYYLLGMSQQEIAGVLELSRVSINKRIKKFEEQVRHHLRNEASCTTTLTPLPATT